ncbi:MAG: acid shock protein [Terriglobia bacterium]
MKTPTRLVAAVSLGLMMSGLMLAAQTTPPATAQPPAQSAQPAQNAQPLQTASPAAAASVSTGQAAGSAQAAPPPIPAGTTLRVQLDTTLTDKTNKTGDKFTGEVTDPIVVNGKEVLPKYSTVNGHIAFLKPSGRMAGKAQMRLVLDNVTTPDSIVYPLSGTLEQAQGGVCAHASNTGKTKADEEGTITGCGKSKKSAAEAAAIAGGMGAGVGASIDMGKIMECQWYGYCPPGGSGIGTDIGYGAGIGATTALVYTLFKHEKHIVLVQGIGLTFIVNRTTMADKVPAPDTASNTSGSRAD